MGIKNRQSNIVEDYIAITTSDFGNLLKADKKKGHLRFHMGLTALNITYGVEQEGAQYSLLLNIEGGISNGFQRVELQTFQAEYGTKWFFSCHCGKRVSKLLYRPSKAHLFACRKCLKLTYKRINKRTSAGMLLYSNYKIKKLAERAELIKTPIYLGQYTRKMQSYLNLHNKWLGDEVMSKAMEQSNVLKG